MSCIDLIFTAKPNLMVDSGVHPSLRPNYQHRQRAFSDINIEERVSFFNKTISNIVLYFVPHKTVICDGRDPPWINTRKILYKKYFCSSKNTKLFEKFKLLQNKTLNLANDSRDRYYTRISNKLNDLHVSLKACWSILKMFLNNQKTPIIPPLFHENNFN